MHANGCATCGDDDGEAPDVRPNVRLVFARTFAWCSPERSPGVRPNVRLVFARTFAERSQQGVRNRAFATGRSQRPSLPFPTTTTRIVRFVGTVGRSCGYVDNSEAARMSGWGGRRAVELTAACLAEWGDACWLCGQPGADTADHVVPRSRGGGNELDNLRPAHRRCNSARGNRPARRPAAPIPTSRDWWT